MTAPVFIGASVVAKTPTHVAKIYLEASNLMLFFVKQKRAATG